MYNMANVHYNVGNPRDQLDEIHNLLACSKTTIGVHNVATLISNNTCILSVNRFMKYNGNITHIDDSITMKKQFLHCVLK